MQKLVSVILPVYNAEDFIYDAVLSILGQSFKPLELIVLDDGSTDGALSILNTINDERLRVYSRENRGLSKTLEELVGLSSCEYIARMDADDIAMPDRIHKQYNYMLEHPECVLLGGNVEYVDEKSNSLGYSVSCYSDKSLRYKLKMGNPIFHPTVMFRRKSYFSTCGYDAGIEKYAEDYLLWLELSKIGELRCLKDVVLKYRMHSNSIMSAKPEGLDDFLRKIGSSGGLYAELKEDYLKINKNNKEVSAARSTGYVLNNISRSLLIEINELISHAKICNLL